MTPTKSVALAIACTTLLVWFSVAFGEAVLEQAASSTWSTATGVIVQSKAIPARTRRWLLDYTYEVSDRQFSGHRYRARPEFILWRNDIYALADKHRPGSTVTVYFNPDQPSASPLDRGLSTGAILGGGSLALMVGFAAAMSWYHLLRFAFGGAKAFDSDT